MIEIPSPGRTEFKNPGNIILFNILVDERKKRMKSKSQSTSYVGRIEQIKHKDLLYPVLYGPTKTNVQPVISKKNYHVYNLIIIQKLRKI
jgi:hypothetical protein